MTATSRPASRKPRFSPDQILAHLAAEIDGRKSHEKNIDWEIHRRRIKVRHCKALRSSADTPSTAHCEKRLRQHSEALAQATADKKLCRREIVLIQKCIGALNKSTKAEKPFPEPFDIIEAALDASVTKEASVVEFIVSGAGDK